MWDNPMQCRKVTYTDLLNKVIQHMLIKWDGGLLASVVPQEEFAKLVSLTSISLGH